MARRREDGGSMARSGVVKKVRVSGRQSKGVIWSIDIDTFNPVYDARIKHVKYTKNTHLSVVLRVFRLTSPSKKVH